MRWLLRITVAAALAAAAPTRFDWGISGGKTRLLGNFFGVSQKNASFDYVIIGGGTAGLTVAHRLASHGNVSVAVIEAGGLTELTHGNTSQVPGYGSTYLTFNSLVPSYQQNDWGFITAPQPGLNNRKIHYTAGRTLGGSSALNDLVFHRGTKGAFDWWANVTGDDDYKYSNFVKYLETSVSFTPPRDKSISYDPGAFKPGGSPLQVSYPNYREPFDSFLEQAFDRSGLRAIPGLNSGNLDGYGAGTYTIDPPGEVRSSSEESFLQDSIANGQPLTVYVNSVAQKVLFNSDQVATGVLVETDGGQYIVSARKEVVVSAGTFQSPKILMLSGIGPREQLQAHGIPIVADLHGVGNNLIDQIFIFSSHTLNITTNSGVLTNPALAAASVEQYLDQQNGPLTGVGGDVLGFEKLPNRTAFTPGARAQLDGLPSDWAEAEYEGLSIGANPDNDTMANNFVFFTSAVFAPFSRGYVNLSSADPADPPIINPNSLSSDTEAQVAVQALHRLRQFAGASGLQAVETSPGPSVQTNAQILTWIRNNAVNGYHASCTCRMGKTSDPDAVIDSKGRVYGVQGLRVVDASAFAILPPGHPMSTIYALSYKIADDILSES